MHLIERISQFLFRAGVGGLSTRELLLVVAILTMVTYMVLIVSGRR